MIRTEVSHQRFQSLHAARPRLHAAAMASPKSGNQLHGITLQKMVTELVAHFGWAELGIRIPIRCFTFDPSVTSSLKFLRKTQWARDKVEGLYTFMLKERSRN